MIPQKKPIDKLPANGVSANVAPTQGKEPAGPLQREGIRSGRRWLALPAVVLVAGILSIWLLAINADEEMRKDLLGRTRLLAGAVNIEQVRSLTGTEADLDDPEYLWLKEQLAAVRQIFPTCRFIYLMGRRSDGPVFFYADSETAGSKDESPPGQIYKEISTEYLRAFDTKTTLVEGPVTDRWGTWMSALVPLTDPRTGSLIAMLGTDLDARQWKRDVAAKSALPAGLATLALLAIVFSGRLLLNRRSRSRGRPPRWMRHLEPVLMISVGLVLTLFAAWVARNGANRNQADSFLQLAMGRTTALARTFNDLRNVELEGLARFFEGREDITKKTFQEYTHYLTRNPSVQAWEWIPAVPASEKERFEQAARAAGMEGFTIWQRDAAGRKVPAAGREIYFPVFRVTPEKGNKAAVGFDLGSETNRSAAIADTLRTGLTTASEPVTLVQETGTQKGLLVFRPVFSGSDARTRRLRGFALAVVPMDDVLKTTDFDNVVTGELGLVHVGKASEQLASSPAGAGPPGNDLILHQPVFAFGRTFIVSAHAGPAFLRMYPARAGLSVTVTGLLLTTALTFVVAMLLHDREVLEERVRERTISLCESEERFSRAIEGTGAGLWEWDMSKNTVFFSSRWKSMLGYADHEVENAFSGWQHLWHPEDAARIEKALKDYLAGKTAFYEIEHRLRHKNGSWHWIITRGDIQRNAAGDPVRWTGTNIDITERKQAELELLKINRKLEETTARANQMAAEAEMADIAKSEFLANMSHEIRTPMNGVIGMTGLLLDTDLSPDQLRCAETVRASGESLLGLINDILDFSKIEAGKLDLEILDFDLQDLLDDFAATLALQAHQKGLELNCGMSPDIPPLLRGDPGRLRQILTNLAGNAVKFTHSGEVSIRVTLESDVPEGVLLRFSVADTGIGIPPEKQIALFQKFSQVDASITRHFGGTGLGLAISRQLAEMMGGEIGVQSATGKGAEFWFTVRMEKQPCRPAAKPLGLTDLKDIRVLIVDDNATNREILTAQMESWHLRVFAVSDGPSALAAIHGALQDNDPYQVAVIDMQMPEMDGGELGRTIASDNRLAGIRMVLLTSLGVRGDSRRFEQIGFNAYLTKPVRPQELKTTLSSILTEHEKGATQPGTITTRHSIREIRDLFAGCGIRILLAEDNITNQQVALGILKKLGLRADAVANGLEVLEALKTLPYDLVLMDVQMPEMDGLEATRQIRAREQQATSLPIIAMTAHAMAGDRERCLEAGMNGYVSKPIDPLALADALETQLRKSPDAGGKGLSAEDDGSAAGKDEPDAARIFHRTALLERLMDDESLMETIITGFLEDMPEQIALLTSFVENGQAEQAGGQAHKIKGAAGNVTARMLQKTAGDMETAGKSGDMASLQRLLPELKQNFLQVKRTINRLTGIERQRP